MIAKYFKAKPEPIEYPEGKDGRQVCNLETAGGRREYARRREILWLRQLGRCATCRRLLSQDEATFGHGKSRGMAGSTRDDRLWDLDGKPLNACLCGPCNVRQGSSKYEWRDGVFQPVERERVTCS